jgi:hypothetical protein
MLSILIVFTILSIISVYIKFPNWVSYVIMGTGAVISLADALSMIL